MFRIPTPAPILSLEGHPVQGAGKASASWRAPSLWLWQKSMLAPGMCHLSLWLGLWHPKPRTPPEVSMSWVCVFLVLPTAPLLVCCPLSPSSIISLSPLNETLELLQYDEAQGRHVLFAQTCPACHCFTPPNYPTEFLLRWGCETLMGPGRTSLTRLALSWE